MAYVESRIRKGGRGAADWRDADVTQRLFTGSFFRLGAFLLFVLTFPPLMSYHPAQYRFAPALSVRLALIWSREGNESMEVFRHDRRSRSSCSLYCIAEPPLLLRLDRRRRWGRECGRSDSAAPPRFHRTRNVILYCISLKSLRFSEEPKNYFLFTSDGKERPYSN